MNKLIRLSPTGIEYGDYAWNFASGCGNNIAGKCKSGGFNCWAYPITQRFIERYPNGFKPTIYPEALLSPLYLKKPSRILCAFMGDLFWGCPEFDPLRRIHYPMPSGKASLTMSLRGWISTTIRQCPQHTFLFLTKQPRNLLPWSPFPDNCWVGITACNASDAIRANEYMAKIKATVKYLSIEPMQDWCLFPETIEAIIGYYNWVILGAQSRPIVYPEIEHVREIVEAADKAGIPVFIKKNLAPYARNIALYPEMKFGDEGDLDVRQEMP